MKIRFFFFLLFVAVGLTACHDDSVSSTPVSAAFSVSSVNLTDAATTVQVLFSKPAPEAGSVSVTFVTTGVTYGLDFTTNPVAAGNTLELFFDKGATTASFVFMRQTNAIEGETKHVVFSIDEVSFGAELGENPTIQLNYNETASLGASLSAETGGPNQPYAVYVDFSSRQMTSAVRTSWDLGFYSGPEFRVILNNSVKMSAKLLSTNNIDEVQAIDDIMVIGQGGGNANQVDHPAGLIEGTTIAAISENENENYVYLVNLGSQPLETAPAIGSEGTASGGHRGWKKIRVLRSGNDYRLQYADVGATTHQEAIISKNTAFNFTFFSLLGSQSVVVEPQRNQWDVCFTTFTNLVNFGSGMVPYHYADFVTTNTKGGARAYQVLQSDAAYDTFTLAQVDEGAFTNDQRNIGSNWRGTSVMGAGGVPVSQFVLRTDRFYVVKDPAGNVYKLRFTGGANQAGERGYPTFEYALLR